MDLILKNITKRFDSTLVVDHIDLEIASGELFFLLGPSGCGKTTILRMLAGFCDPDEGSIWFDTRTVNNVPPQDRNTALVFQNYAIWPHMTVFENVAYGLRVRKLPEATIRSRVEATLDKIKMLHLSERKPASLSGGQQQRVALARAIVVDPQLLLFDEPLSNLDAKLRLEIRGEIKKLHAGLKTTSVYVTHDQEEALAMADRIAVMNAGQIQQVGTPYEIYNKPVNPFVASFIGEINILPPTSLLALKLGSRGKEQLAFRPEKVETSPRGIPVTVVTSSCLGSRNEMVLKTAHGGEIKAWLPEYFRAGTTIKIQIRKENILRFKV
ncbi:MAG: ABC transporter ATP-binding protein [Methylacidiphilales bacterium]|nr:ABC transporter ATP-binding protein [Candidatus Methylacidiphilales bacterium]